MESSLMIEDLPKPAGLLMHKLVPTLPLTWGDPIHISLHAVTPALLLWSLGLVDDTFDFLALQILGW